MGSEYRTSDSQYNTFHTEEVWFVAVQPLSHICQLSVTPWTAGRQASLSFTVCRSLFRCMSIVSVMLSNHLILCCPLLLLPSIFLCIRVFSNESVFHIRWPKYWSSSFSISSSNEYSGLISFRIDCFDWFDLLFWFVRLWKHRVMSWQIPGHKPKLSLIKKS